MVKDILKAQRSELTEHYIYARLANAMKDGNNKDTLLRISKDELEHSEFWKGYSKEDVKPDRFKILTYVFISRIFGLTFGLKLMEKGEGIAKEKYKHIASAIPDVNNLIQDEDAHERTILGLLDEERLKYIGSIVLGLNDALVELTGALAGFTLVLQKSRLIALVGLVTGIAGALSMSASAYLSSKSEGTLKNSLNSALYTGISYILVVLFLIFPYLILANVYLSLFITIFNAILVILVFTYYISIAKDLRFFIRFLEMAGISFGVAVLSFLIGFIIRKFFNIEI